jgi:hypothetical protein
MDVESVEGGVGLIEFFFQFGSGGSVSSEHLPAHMVLAP